MATVKLILTIIQVLGAVFLTFVVLAQSGKSAGLSGAIAGGADTFLFCCAGAFCVILESTVMRYKGDHPFYEFTRNLPGLLQGLRLFHP